MPPLFTVLLPIIRPPAFLPFAIESVQAQSVADFELCVICDGAPPETVACAEDYARHDPRVKVFAHPKGARQGEAYRHNALAASTARYVAHICDDDLWFPNHLAEMEILLTTADFGNLVHVYVHPDGAIELLAGNLGRPETRRRMLTEKFNIFGPTYAGYRMDAYRRLPEGWAPAPADIWTDLHMWRKFLAMEELTFATRATVTAIHFAAPERLDVTLEQRADENRAHLERIRDPRKRDEIAQAAWRSLLDKAARYNEQIGVEGELGRMTAARDRYQAELARMTVSRDSYQAELGRMTASRDAFQANSETLTKALTETQAERDRMVRSKSWRLTSPLRALVAKLKLGH